MRNLPKLFFSWPAFFVYVGGCSLFFLAFTVVYDPFSMRDFLDMGRGLYSLNLSILFAILLVLLGCLRLALRFMKDSKKFTWAAYVTWCIGECLVLALAASLYLTLMLKGEYSYFTVLFGYCIGNTYLILIYPYLVITLAFEIAALKQAEQARASTDESLIRFFDEYKNPKLLIAAGAVLYIEAQENYVDIWYLDSGRPRKFNLRASMRSLEETAERHGLVRCQRSYYVNPSHVTVLRRENGWVYADLDQEGLPSIPVSKTYYDKLAKLL